MTLHLHYPYDLQRLLDIENLCKRLDIFIFKGLQSQYYFLHTELHNNARIRNITFLEAFNLRIQTVKGICCLWARILLHFELGDSEYSFIRPILKNLLKFSTIILHEQAHSNAAAMNQIETDITNVVNI